MVENVLTNNSDTFRFREGVQFGLTIRALDGDDTIISQDSTYEMLAYGDDGNDLFTGFAQSSRLHGGAGNDTIEGGGQTSIFGEAGDDVILRGPGNSYALLPVYEFGESAFRGTISGGEGNDSISVEEFADLSFREPGAYSHDTDLDGGSGNDTLALLGHEATDFDVTATATGFSFLLTDTMAEVRGISVDGFEAFRFADRTMSADEVRTELATAIVTGTEGDDVLDTNPTTEQVQAGAGNDRVIYRGGDDTIGGGAGFDTIDFGAHGGPAEVFLQETRFSPANTFFNSTLEAEGARTQTDTDGADIVLDGFEAAFGSDFDDELTGLSGADLLDGGTGNDTLFGTEGADTLRGGDGIDWVNYDLSFRAPVTVSLATGTGARNFAEGDVLSGIENIFGSRAGDNLTGDDGANHLHGGWSTIPDFLTGGGGNDTLDGGTGYSLDFEGTAINNVAFFSGNRDEYDITIAAAPFVLFRSGSHTITVDHARGSQTDGTDTLIDIGILRFADGDINLFDQPGTDGDDVFYGVFNVSVGFSAGREAIVPMNGGAGNDLFIAGEVNNAMNGGTGRDTADFSGYLHAVTFDLEAGTATSGSARNGPLVTVDLVSIADARGTAFDDVFHGSDGSNRFLGLGDDDMFYGSWGGRDVYLGGAGKDHLSYAAAAQGVSASLFAGKGWSGQAAADVYDRIEMLTGTQFDDALTGDHGNNVLYGLGGDDTLMANGGNDTIYAGAGTDTILFGFDRDAYAISSDQNLTVARHLVSGHVDLIYDAEILRFADGDLIL